MITVELGVQLNHWIRMARGIGVLDDVGQGFINSNGQVIDQYGGGTSAAQPLRETHPQPARAMRGGLGEQVQRLVTDAVLLDFPAEESSQQASTVPTVTSP